MTRTPRGGRPRWRRPRTASDRGSMPLALLLTLVGISLSALLVPVVVNQMTATRTASERVQALHAAQAGVDVAVGQIRAAADAAGNGLVERLPSCELAGSLFPEDGKDSPRYRVGITYYDAAGGDLGCAPTDVPATASIESTGTEAPDAAFAAGTAGTRTIKATYAFQTTNANIVGGAIPVAQPASPQLCMDAGPEASPKAGTLLQMQKCQPGASRQRFAYTEDLSLKLVGSETPETEGAPLGMCLDAGSPQKTGANVVFQPCKGRTPQQQWSLNDNSNFQGTGNGVTMNSFCFNLKNPGAPGGVVLGSCGTTLNRQVFRAQTGVGTGMAGAPTGQLVNFRQFSRCMDVTDFTVTRPYMIVWFCKQAPDGNVRWNQKWLFPKATPTGTTGRIRTVNDAGAGYCLRSPASTAANQYVTLAACTATGTLASNLTWTLYGSTGDYTTSYRIVDHYGNCLTPTDLDALQPDTHSDGTSKAKVAVCDSSELQKWNAPANLNRPLPLTDITEK